MHGRTPSFTLNGFFCDFFFCYVLGVVPKSLLGVRHAGIKILDWKRKHEVCIEKMQGQIAKNVKP